MPDKLSTCRRFILPILLPTVAVSIFSAVLIRNLWRLFGRLSSLGDTAATLSEIFRQLDDAEIIACPIFALILFTVITLMQHSAKQKMPLLRIGISVLLGIAAVILTLYFTQVNGVYFGDVITSLIGLILKGGLEL